MELLIDGYNLLHATDLFGSGAAAGTLEGSREALLTFLVDALTASERRRTTIVFDANDAPPGLPATITRDAIIVHFARNYPDADAMIEALIEDRPRGKGLLVVSSDRRVQRAARSHGARWAEAVVWYRELQARRDRVGDNGFDKTISEVEGAEYWTDRFADAATLKAIEDEQQRAETAKANRQAPASSANRSSPGKKPGQQQKGSRPNKPQQPFGEGIFEGFPPGYADDLADQLKAPPDDDPPNE